MQKDKKKTACFITARTDSSRLPGKALLPIRGKRVIEHIIDRAKLCKNADLIVLCTSRRKKDDILEEIAHKKKIECFRGNLHDVLGRWLAAAKKFDVGYFVSFDGDDLFCEPTLMDLAIDQIRRKNLDFIVLPPGLICGAAAYAFSSDALERALGTEKYKNMEMHQWLNIGNTSAFKIDELEVKNPLFFNNKIRATLDYQEDLDFFRRVFDELGTNINNVSLSRIARLLKAKPELININRFRQEDFLKNQMKKIKLKLKKK